MLGFNVEPNKSKDTRGTVRLLEYVLTIDTFAGKVVCHHFLVNIDEV